MINVAVVKVVVLTMMKSGKDSGHRSMKFVIVRKGSGGGDAVWRKR